MSKLLLALAICALAAGGCSKSEPKYRDYSDATQVHLRKALPDDNATPRQFGSLGTQHSAPTMLAYSYRYGFELPADNVTALKTRHEKACAASGPAICQVMASEVNNIGGELSAELKIRAAPAWLSAFRNGLSEDAAAAGGRIRRSAIEVEDLTRAIVDVEAQLKAKTILRARLQSMLATRPGDVSDLVAIERELARVQGEIDSTQGQLNLMRGRVEMSDVTLSYDSAPRALSGQTGEPLRRAATGALGTVAVGLAAMITAAAFLTPWIIVAVPLSWLLLRWRRNRKARKIESRTQA